MSATGASPPVVSAADVIYRRMDPIFLDNTPEAFCQQLGEKLFGTEFQVDGQLAAQNRWYIYGVDSWVYMEVIAIDLSFR
ncbi:MAG: hypothetical protein M1272_05515 [Firmicutes bacterium]|nr:hypothetical protein [Bacillota bacterium]